MPLPLVALEEIEQEMNRPNKTNERHFVGFKTEERQSKLLAIISKYFGPSASHKYKYNV